MAVGGTQVTELPPTGLKLGTDRGFRSPCLLHFLWPADTVVFLFIQFPQVPSAVQLHPVSSFPARRLRLGPARELHSFVPWISPPLRLADKHTIPCLSEHQFHVALWPKGGASAPWVLFQWNRSHAHAAALLSQGFASASLQTWRAPAGWQELPRVTSSSCVRMEAVQL